MTTTRRKFLKAGSLFAVSLGLPLKSVLGQQVPKGGDGNPFDRQDVPSDPLSHYTRSAFESYLNSIFRLYTGYSTVEIALVEVKNLLPETVTGTDGRESFSLLFRGGSAALRQNTYAIEHPSLGKFQLFLVPGGPDDNGAQSYVAIINRLSRRDALNPAPSRLSRSTPAARRPETVTPPVFQPLTPATNTPVAPPIVILPAQTAGPSTGPAKKKKRRRKNISRTL